MCRIEAAAAGAATAPPAAVQAGASQAPRAAESVKLELEEPWPLGVGLGVDDDYHYLTARLYLVVPNQQAQLAEPTFRRSL